MLNAIRLGDTPVTLFFPFRDENGAALAIPGGATVVANFYLNQTSPPTTFTLTLSSTGPTTAQYPNAANLLPATWYTLVVASNSFPQNGDWYAEWVASAGGTIGTGACTYAKQIPASQGQRQKFIVG
jgi:hypothetical protein